MYFLPGNIWFLFLRGKGYCGSFPESLRGVSVSERMNRYGESPCRLEPKHPLRDGLGLGLGASNTVDQMRILGSPLPSPKPGIPGETGLFLRQTFQVFFQALNGKANSRVLSSLVGSRLRLQGGKGGQTGPRGGRGLGRGRTQQTARNSLGAETCHHCGWQGIAQDSFQQLLIGLSGANMFCTVTKLFQVIQKK